MHRVSGRLLVVGLAAWLAACAIQPPVQEMSDARQAIAAAEAAGADRLAVETLAEARRYLAEAEADIVAESYGPARIKAVRAQDRAMRALQRALEAEETD